MRFLAATLYRARPPRREQERERERETCVRNNAFIVRLVRGLFSACAAAAYKYTRACVIVRRLIGDCARAVTGASRASARARLSVCREKERMGMSREREREREREVRRCAACGENY